MLCHLYEVGMMIIAPVRGTTVHGIYSTLHHGITFAAIPHGEMALMFAYYDSQ